MPENITGKPLPVQKIFPTDQSGKSLTELAATKHPGVVWIGVVLLKLWMELFAWICYPRIR